MDFLRRVDVPVAAQVKPDIHTAVYQRVREEIASRSPSSERSEKQIRTAVHMATTVYCQSNTDVQVHIAIYTALLLSIDDFDIPQIATDEFIPRLLRGSSQLHPAIDHVVDNLRHMSDYFPRRAAQAISTSALNFINRTIFDTEQADHVLSQDAIRYVEWTRIKDGIGEAYAYFIWDKFKFPDTTSYIQAIPCVLLL